MMNNIDFSQPEVEKMISKQELDAILVARNKLLLVDLNKQVVELELKNLILQTYIRHGLTEKDIIDETTGKIKRTA